MTSTIHKIVDTFATGATLYGWKFVEFADVETLLAFDLSSNDKNYTG